MKSSGVIQLMNKFILLLGIILMSGLTTLWLKKGKSAARLQEQNQMQQQQLAQLAVENERLSNRLSQTSAPPSAKDDHLAELLRLRNEVSTLRRVTNAPK